MAGVLKLFAGIIQTGLDYPGAYHPDEEHFVPLNLALIEKQIDSPGIAGLDHDGSSFIFAVEQVLGQIMGAGLVKDKPIDLFWLVGEQWTCADSVGSTFVADDAIYSLPLKELFCFVTDRFA
jgi:hypothetical protein